MPRFRTRQAPSPTGYLHLGTARQMLFTKLLAISQNGDWYLRLEDTDRKRLQASAVGTMLDSLENLGLLPDEGITSKGSESAHQDEFYNVYQVGKYGPYIQSERLDLYHEHAQNMIDQRLSYWCYLTPEEIEELQAVKKATRTPIDYFKIFSERQSSEDLYRSVASALGDERHPTLRFKLKRDEVVVTKDVLVGETSFDLNLEEDFVCLKSDGYPTYHFAHVIDDHLMETTLVFRAQEWLPSLPKHWVMFREYWHVAPDYLHIPFILGETGNKKMSKRDGNVNMDDYLRKGYLPEAIINYLAFLGWNPGTEQELYLEPSDFIGLTWQERVQKLINNLAADFSMDKIQHAPARFNLEKLNWFNREYIKMMSLPEFALRSCENRRDQKFESEFPRDSDYVYLVDTKTQNVFAINEIADKWQLSEPFRDNKDVLMLGGGREAGEIGKVAAAREVLEETEQKLKIKQDKLIEINTFQLHSETREFGDVSLVKVDTNNLHNYFYELRESEINSFEGNEGGDIVKKSWIQLPQVIESNSVLRYPLWADFCQRNGINLFEPTLAIKQQYLAWLLDKQRITVLSELGTESDCVLNWVKPLDNDLKFKKQSFEEARSALQKIFNEVIQPFYDTEAAQDVLTAEQAVADMSVSFGKPVDEILTKFTENASIWERVIKDWIAVHSLDTGAHLWPLRVALSGKAKSPSPFELLAILSREQITTRITLTISNES